MKVSKYRINPYVSRPFRPHVEHKPDFLYTISSYEYLAFPHDVSDASLEVVKHHRHLKFWSLKGRRWIQRWLGEYMPPEDTTGLNPTGTCDVQVVRSSSRWSHGIETEHSIQNACKHPFLNSLTASMRLVGEANGGLSSLLSDIQMIQEAEHFIYIGIVFISCI